MQPKFCTKCGKALIEGDKFCRNCGAPIRMVGKAGQQESSPSGSKPSLPSYSDNEERFNRGSSREPSRAPYSPERTVLSASPSTTSGIENKKSNRLLPVIIIAAVIIAIVGGIVFFVTSRLGSGSDAEGKITNKSSMSSDTEDIRVLSSDWDWDSSIQATSNGLYKVDAIFWIKNDSQNAITGIDYEVYSKRGELIENALEPGASMTAYGYIESGKSGIMVGESWTSEKEVYPDGKTYHISNVYVNNDMSGYVVPKGIVSDNYGPNYDVYDISLNNLNNSAVNSNARIVMVYIDGGKIKDADATGHIDSPIPANTTGYIQEGAFFNPHLNTKHEDMTVYAIDIDRYKKSK